MGDDHRLRRQPCARRSLSSAATASANCSSPATLAISLASRTLGTIEYGAAVLGSPLVVILAHTACGAVKAACDIVTKNATYPGVIGRMIEPIVPAALAVRNDLGDFADNTAKESAKRTAANLPTVSKIVSDLVGAGKVKIVAAIYDLQTGVVTYLD